MPKIPLVLIIFILIIATQGCAHTVLPSTTSISNAYSYTITITSINQTITSSSTTTIKLSSIATIPDINKTINIGDIIWLKAIGTYSDNTSKDVTYLVNWTSSNDNIVKIYKNSISNVSNGAMGQSVGIANITATLDNISSPAISLIVENNLQYITLTDIKLSKNQFQINVIGFYADGTSENLTSQAIYVSSNPSVIFVAPTGIATISSSGNVKITVYIPKTNISSSEQYNVLPF